MSDSKLPRRWMLIGAVVVAFTAGGLLYPPSLVAQTDVGHALSVGRSERLGYHCCPTMVVSSGAPLPKSPNHPSLSEWPVFTETVLSRSTEKRRVSATHQ